MRSNGNENTHRKTIIRAGKYVPMVYEGKIIMIIILTKMMLIILVMVGHHHPTIDSGIILKAGGDAAQLVERGTLHFMNWVRMPCVRSKRKT